MEFVMSVVIAVLFGSGLYLIMSRVLLRVVFGTSLLSHATLLYLMTIGKLQRGAAPILDPSKTAYVDPIPQALNLTAIVIGFGVTALVIVLAYRAYQSLGTDDLEDYRGLEEDEH